MGGHLLTGEIGEFLYRAFRYEAYCEREEEGGGGELQIEAVEMVTIRRK